MISNTGFIDRGTRYSIHSLKDFMEKIFKEVAMYIGIVGLLIVIILVIVIVRIV